MGSEGLIASEEVVEAAGGTRMRETVQSNNRPQIDVDKRDDGVTDKRKPSRSITPAWISTVGVFSASSVRGIHGPAST